MTRNLTLASALLGVLVLGSAVGLAQNAFPGPDQAGLFAEVKAMHADMKRAIEANTRAQIVTARLASQDARVATASAQVADAQSELAEATKARTDAENSIRRLTQSLADQQGELRAATSRDIAETRRELGDLQHREQAARAELAKMQQASAAERTRRNELSVRLDELEQTLSAR